MTCSVTYLPLDASTPRMLVVARTDGFISIKQTRRLPQDTGLALATSQS